jgi:MFS superfamily sulfate permease-like transporter
LARVLRTDFVAAVIAMLGVVLEGLLIAIGVSLAVFIWKRWRPYTAVLGRAADTKGYHDTERHPDTYLVPKLLLFHFDAPILFANAGFFEEQLGEAIDATPGGVRRVVVAALPISDIDSTGAKLLEMLLDGLDVRGIEFAFAELKGPDEDRLCSYGLYDRIGAWFFYATLGVAVMSHADETGVAPRNHGSDEEGR